MNARLRGSVVAVAIGALALAFIAAAALRPVPVCRGWHHYALGRGAIQRDVRICRMPGAR